MRRSIVGLLAAVLTMGALALTTYGTGSLLHAAQQVSQRDCKYGQCAYIKADGYQCRNCAQEGRIYCWSHRDK